MTPLRKRKKKICMAGHLFRVKKLKREAEWIVGYCPQCQIRIRMRRPQ